MTEQFKNFGRTTLNGGINNSTTSIVVNDGSVFPSGGDFRIVIDSELMLCTARTGNTLTVTRGHESTSAASHLDLASVAHILTAGSLTAIIQENSIQSVVGGQGISVNVSSPKNPIVNLSGITPASSGGTGQNFNSGSGVPNFANGVASLLQFNLAATAAPVVGSDNTKGYSVGSVWVDTTNDRVYQSVDVSTGAAVWRRLDGVVSATAGSGISVDNTDPRNPVIHSTVTGGGGIVNSVVAGTNCTVDSTDPANPIVNANGVLVSVVAGTGISIDNTDPNNPVINASVGGQVNTVVAGSNISVDATDPVNPIVNYIGPTGIVGSISNGDNIWIDSTDPSIPIVHSSVSYPLGVASGGTGTNLFSAGSGAIVHNGNGTSAIGYLPKWNFTATTRPGVNDSNADGYIRGSIISITNPADLTESGVYFCSKDTDGSAVWKRLDNLNSNSSPTPNERNILPGFDQDNGYTYGSIHTNWGDNAYICVTPSTSSASWKRITSDVNSIFLKPSGGIVFEQFSQASGTWSLGFRSTQTVPVANDPYDLLHGSFIGIGTMDRNRVRGVNARSVLGNSTASSGTGPVEVITAASQYTYLGYGEAGTVVFTPVVGSGITQGSVNPDRLQSQAAGTFVGRDGGSAGFPGLLTPQSGVVVDGSNVRLGIPGLCGHRLTLASATPYMVDDTTASTVYFTPTGKDFSGMVSTYNGTKWITKSYPQTSVSLVGTASGVNFDFFFYDNNGAGLLEKVNWTDNTTRATALTTQDGVYVKSGAASGLFVGMGRTGLADNCQVRYATSSAPARCFLVNQYNCEQTTFVKNENTASWTYNSTTPRAMNNSNANRVEFVTPYREKPIYGKTIVNVGSANVTGITTICLNATNRSESRLRSGHYANTAVTAGTGFSDFQIYPSGGFNFAQAVEFCSTATSATFYSGVDTANSRAGIEIIISC